ncbi:MAG: MarR family winged helix-turn-helix transcriptional regulator [Blastomonas fulva]|uniref:MarR family winged helix-turn-helix transcriptional regulator n=1 Tax=Blastomonas fulva TaxID=1550728 RepID=UPI00083D0187|nr:MarR family transcriptional regulator [Blastomonas fulva]MCO5793870.1 MarR family transcriptional regulator [Blastomonas sp.]MDK2756803.1 MarR family transcriptional regulator [Blastomonas fulva]MDM7929653.1 MarR family transcriptional regulator [Blastomonas fulva]MDM7965519.1 MarR family transcriptional regulator [Blastomonas fulva]
MAVTKEPRDKILARVLSARHEQESHAPLPAAGLDDAQWQDLRAIIEGLVFAQRPIRAAAQKVAQKHGISQQSPFILSLLQGGLVYPVELASALQVSRSLITKEITRLQDAGLIHAEQDPHDKRRTALVLTEAGERVCGEARAAMARDILSKLGRYSPRQVDQFVAMLKDFGGFPTPD